MAKTLIDYMSEQDYARYKEIISMAEQAKANAPKAPRAPRGPMTKEQKIKMAQGRMAKAKEALERLLAEQAGSSDN